MPHATRFTCTCTHTYTLYSRTGADRLLCSGDGSNASAGYLPSLSDPYVQVQCYPLTSPIPRSLSGLLPKKAFPKRAKITPNFFYFLIILR